MDQVKREYQVDYSVSQLANSINYVCSLPSNNLYKLSSYNELAKSFEIVYASKSLLGTSTVKVSIQMHAIDENKTKLVFVGDPSGNSFHQEILESVANDAFLKILDHMNKSLNNQLISDDEFSKGDVNAKGCFGSFLMLISIGAAMTLSIILFFL
jgi:hypothetical protein